MKHKYLKLTGGLLASAIAIALTANAETFFSEGSSNTKEVIQDSETFKKELGRINKEKNAMLSGLNTKQVAPDVENLNQTAPQVDISNFEGIDIDAIAQKYERTEQQIQAGERVYIFVTLDMPKSTLRKLAQDVAKVDGALVLRGFYDGSLKKTYARIGELGLKSGNIQVNPDAFHKYKIDKAPSFVLVKKLGMYESLDLDGCAIPEDYIKISGDVSLDFALEKMEASVEDATEKNMIKKQLNRLA